MTSLAELQKLFKTSVMTGTEDILPEIAEGGRIGPVQRLAIYTYAYGARLRETLEKDFPVLHTLLGDNQFYNLCNAYIAACPSQHPSLRFFGRHMAEFLGREEFASQPFLSEMARFEWTFIDTFDAPDVPTVSLEEIGALAPECWTTLRFEFHPSVHVDSFDWNVPAVWSSATDEQKEQALPQKNPEKVTVLQWRNEMVSYYRSLDCDEASALEKARQGADFPAFCECLVDFHAEQAPQVAAGYLKSWILEGLVSGFDYARLG